MPAKDKKNLIISAQDFDIVTDILHTFIPSYHVWAYGSRANGTAHQGSDLDLVIRNPYDLTVPCPDIGRLKSEFSNSNIVILTDILDWARLPESFHKNIESSYIIIQPNDIL